MNRAKPIREPSQFELAQTEKAKRPRTSLRRLLCRAAPLMIAPPFSAIIIVSALVLIEVTAAITEASMTRNPSMPCALGSSQTTP